MATKKIMLNLTFLQDQYYRRGIGRYGVEMMRRVIVEVLQSAAEIELQLIGFGTLEKNLRLLDFDELAAARIQGNAAGKISFHSLGKVHLSSPLRNLRTYFNKVRPLVRELKPDLYFAAHFEHPIPTDLVQSAVAVHDAIPLQNGQFSSQGWVFNLLKGIYYKWAWGKGVRAAALVFTCSQVSRQDLIEFGKVDPGRIRVVYLGISDVFKSTKLLNDQKLVAKTLQHFRLSTKGRVENSAGYLIYDGGLDANKNIEGLLGIFSLVHKHMPDLQLVITGGDLGLDGQGKYQALNHRGVELLKLASQHQVAAAIRPVGKVSEPELAILTAHATAYINMSNYEGFGFGPLQAMAVGTPAIVSNRGSFPEVSGAAALVVEPNDVGQAAAQVIELLSSPERMQHLQDLGQAHSQQYNWDHTFSQTWSQLTSILGGNK